MLKRVLTFIVFALPSFAVAAEKPPILLKGHTGWVAAVAFSPDSKTLASGGADNVVRLWDVATGKETAVLKGHTDYVCAAAFSPDGKTLATGSFDGTAACCGTSPRQAVGAIRSKSTTGESVLSVAFVPKQKVWRPAVSMA